MRWAAAGTAASLLLIWICSGWYFAGWDGVGVQAHTQIAIHRGRIHLYRLSTETPYLLQLAHTARGWRIARNFPMDHRWDWGFLWEQREGSGRPFTIVEVAVPLWALALPAALLAAMLWHVRRPRPGRCNHCGYNLSGLPPAAPCPECGRLIA